MSCPPWRETATNGTVWPQGLHRHMGRAGTWEQPGTVLTCQETFRSPWERCTQRDAHTSSYQPRNGTVRYLC